MAKPIPEPMSLERRLVWILLSVLLLPVGPIIFAVPRVAFGLLWDYAAAAVAGVAFPVVFILAKRRGEGLLVSTIKAIKWSVISLGVLVVLLFISGIFYGPGYKPFTLGYWIHAKLWFNPKEARQWALTQTNVTKGWQEIPPKDWPAAIKNFAPGAEMLFVDPATKTVTLVEGGGFGHWGITVAQLSATNEVSRDYCIKLDKGAWVWHEIQ